MIKIIASAMNQNPKMQNEKKDKKLKKIGEGWNREEQK